MARASSSPRKGGARPGGKAKAAKAAKKPAPANKKSAAARKREAAAKAAKRKASAEAKRTGQELELARTGLTGAARTVENAGVYLNIYSDWLKGYTYAALAAKHGLSIGRIEQVVGSLRGQNISALRLRDPRLGQRIAHDLILRWSNAISEYAKLAADTKNDSVKLGALRQRDQAIEGYTGVMQELGYLPKHLGTLRIVEDWDAMIDTILDELEKHGVSLEVQRAIVDAVERVNNNAPVADAEGTAEEVHDAVLAA